MSNPLHAAYYADLAEYHSVTVEENVPLARDTFRVRFACPALARRIRPGQFLMLRLAQVDDPLLARPLALYDVALSPSGEPHAVDVVYYVMGKMTRRLAEYRPGQGLEVWGPLGNGFPFQEAEHLVMVAGGIGQTPFLALAKEHLGLQQYGQGEPATSRPSQVTLCYGARSADLLAGLEDFAQAGVQVQVSTDDGSQGHHGLVTDLLEQVLDAERRSVRVVCCGPEPMMQRVAQIAGQRQVPCQVSLETPMACGIGICFTCVAKIREQDSDQWDYRRTCVEGPVFDAQQVVW